MFIFTLMRVLCRIYSKLFISVNRCENGKEIVQIWWGYLLLHYVEYEHLGWGHSWNKGHLRQAKQACALISGNPLPA